MQSESESHSVMSDSLWPHGQYNPWSSLGQNTRVGSLSLLQWIFPTQRSNPGLLHCRQILYQLSNQGSPRILELVAYPFSSGSSWSRNRTGGLLHCRWILYQLSYEGNPYMQSTSFKMLGWLKLKLESRLPGEISITSDMQMTPPLWKKMKK